MTRFIKFLALLALLVVVTPAQEPAGPVERQNLNKALQVGGLSDKEFADIVQQRHAAFEMTASDEESFRKLGAGEALIGALWEYDAFKVPAGPPLTGEQIVTLLQAGTPSRRMERIIQERKVKMVVEKSATDQIAKAGGSATLIGVILTNLTEEKPTEVKPAVVVPVVREPTKEEIKAKYDTLIADAKKANDSGDHLRATEILADAKKLDRSRPEAFQTEGYIWLYSMDSISRGGLEYKEAIAKGGEVELRVEHVHGLSKLMKEQTCLGRMWISKAGVRYEASDKVHMFRFTRKQIMEADRDKEMKVKESGFHIRVDDGHNKADTLHFRAARSKDRAEEDTLIVELLSI